MTDDMMELWGTVSFSGVPRPDENVVLAVTDLHGHLCGALCGTGELATNDEFGQIRVNAGGTAVVWDSTRRRLTLRRAGVDSLSLYYHVREQTVYFATRLPRLLHLLKSLSLQFEEKCLTDLLMIGFILPPYTAFADVLQLAPRVALQFGDRNDGRGITWMEVPQAAGKPENGDRSSDIRSPAYSSSFVYVRPNVRSSRPEKKLVVSTVSMFNEIANCTAQLGEPVSDPMILQFSSNLIGLEFDAGGIDIVSDLLAAHEIPPYEIVPVDQRFGSILHSKWRQQFTGYWLEERRPALLRQVGYVAVDSRDDGDPDSWLKLVCSVQERLRIMSQLAANSGKRIFFGANEPGAVPGRQADSHSQLLQRGFSLAAPEVGNLYSNVVRLHNEKALLGKIAFNKYFDLAPLRIRKLLITRESAAIASMDSAFSALVSLEYLMRFAHRLPATSISSVMS